MTRYYRPRRGPVRRWTERILLLAGVIGIGIWAWSIGSTVIYQDWANWAFDRRVDGESTDFGAYVHSKLSPRRAVPPETATARPVTSPSTPPVTTVEPSAPPAPEASPAPEKKRDPLLGRLSIPRLDLHAMVREGVDEKTLSLALGHIPGTAFPGESGNVGVAGHRDTLFRGLRRIQRNDIIRFETESGAHEYRVERTRIVKPKDVSVLASHETPELTLVTCYPFYYVGSAPDRFIVTAREVLPKAPAPATASADSSRAMPAETKAAADPVEEPDANREAPEPNPAVADTPPVKASVRKPRATQSGFEISRNHSRQLAPGISMGVTGIQGQRVNGWMWVMPDRRTIWLRNQRLHEPVVFYGHRDGRMHKLVITSVARNSVHVSLR